MKRYYDNRGCVNCQCDIDLKVYNYSVDKYEHPLCRSCQVWFKDILFKTTATDRSIDLYFALKERGVPAKLEKSDGFKTIDIAVPDAKVNIEVDGMHHAYNGKQALADLRRILHSYKKGYTTLRIPNALVQHDIQETADLITEYLITSRQKKAKRYY